MTQTRICVAGATGYLGTRTVQHFRAAGFQVTAVAKDRSRPAVLQHLVALGADLQFVDAALGDPYGRALSLPGLPT